MAGIGCVCKDLYVALQIWATANATAGCRLSSVSDLTLQSVLVLPQLPGGGDSWAGTCPCSGRAVAGATREGGATGPLLLQLSSGCWSWWLPVPSNTSPALLCPVSSSVCSTVAPPALQAFPEQQTMLDMASPCWFQVQGTGEVADLRWSKTKGLEKEGGRENNIQNNRYMSLFRP